MSIQVYSLVAFGIILPWRLIFWLAEMHSDSKLQLSELDPGIVPPKTLHTLKGKKETSRGPVLGS